MRYERLSYVLLQRLYAERREEIDNKLLEFKGIRDRSDSEIFEELIYCILTVQSSARSAGRAIERLKVKGLLFRGSAREVERALKGVRFAKTKAKRIINARRLFSSVRGMVIKTKLPADPHAARSYLAEEVDGMGYKEASHFLRNIGYQGLAILDRHVLRGLYDLEAIDEVPRSLTKKRYLAIERLYFDLARKAGICPEALDLVLWSARTGEILK
jgi:N-glycosylase/DNA lyase